MTYSLIPHSAKEIALHIDGLVEGDDSVVVQGVDALEKATPEMLTWVGSPKYAAQAASSAASVIVMPIEGVAPPNKTVIRVDDPDLAMCQVLALMAPPQGIVTPGVHPSAVLEKGAVVDGAAIGANAVVAEDAIVGEGTTLYPGVYVGRGTIIGRNCTLWPNVVLREHITIGDDVVIHANCTIGADGFSYIQRGGKHVRVPQVGTVIIEDEVEIGANSTVDRARSGATIIRKGSKLDNLVMVAHNCDIGEGSVLAGMTGIAGSTTLGKYVVCGGRVTIIDHLEIGTGVQIGAASGVLNDIPDGELIRGNPARGLSQFGREHAALKRLPELLKTVRKLEKRIVELEEG